MLRYFSPDYTGDPFVLFGVPHLFTTAAIGLLGFVAIRTARSGSPEAKRRLRHALAWILLVNEASWHVWNVAHGMWDVQRMLPLHMCSAMVWISIYAFLADNRSLYPLVYFLGVAGAVQAVITPDAGMYGFPHFRFFQTMIAHGGLVIAGLWVVLVEDFRPDLRTFGRVIAGLNVYAVFVWLVNTAIGSTYLYMGGKPENASVMDLFPEWPWYVVILEVLALGVLWLLYLPFRRQPEPVMATNSSSSS